MALRNAANSQNCKQQYSTVLFEMQLCREGVVHWAAQYVRGFYVVLSILFSN
jgi:hypothetical protein